jgi:hypothetical protein
MPKYPHVHVKLIGEDGNAFSIIGRVTRAMRKAKVPEAGIKAYKEEAMAGDYDHLLATTVQYVSTTEE